MSAADFKAKGNAFYSQGDYIQAIENYSKAIELNDKEHTFFSNRSAAYFALNEFEKSVEDARQCVIIAPKWIKVVLQFLDKHNFSSRNTKFRFHLFSFFFCCEFVCSLLSSEDGI
tara:strand:+ start:1218 stop:1562 length:345 start_codon:yes stop_codon:yes gene_type:complete